MGSLAGGWGRQLDSGVLSGFAKMGMGGVCSGILSREKPPGVQCSWLAGPCCGTFGREHSFPLKPCFPRPLPADKAKILRHPKIK